MMAGIFSYVCNLANGQTLEVRVDKVAMSANGANETMIQVAQDWQHTYVQTTPRGTG